MTKLSKEVSGMKKRELEVELVGFCGFYDTTAGTELDTQIESDLSNVPSCFDVLNMRNWDCWYFNDSAYRQDFSNILMGDFMDMVVSKLGHIIPMTVSTDPVVVSSPAYYNFTTDRLFKKVVVSKKGFNRLMSFLRRYPKFCKKVFENYFTSYDGFTSFYPNTLDYWFSRKFKTVTNLEFAYLIHCALCIVLGSLDKYVSSVRELEYDVECVAGFSYREYMDEDLFKKEFDEALKKANLEPCKEFVEDVINGMCIYAMEFFTIKGNKIVLDK